MVIDELRSLCNETDQDLILRRMDKMWEQTDKKIEALFSHSGVITGTVAGAIVGFILATEIAVYLSDITVELAGSVGYFIFKALLVYYGAIISSQLGKMGGRALDYGVQRKLVRHGDIVWDIKMHR